MLKKTKPMKQILAVFLSVFLMLSILSVTGSADAPLWKVNTPYSVGNLVSYNGSEYKCIVAHTSQADWSPEAAPAIWEKVSAGPTNTPAPTNTPTPTKPASNTSTPTVTPTPTQPGVSYNTLSGFIEPDFSFTTEEAPRLKAGFKLEVADTEISTQTNENGYFTLNIPKNLTVCTIKISKPAYLLREIKNISINSSLALSSQSSPLAMWAGDLLVDQAINMSDILEIVNVFNSVPGDGKYNEICDLNLDKAINMTDITILIKNFNKATADYPPVVPTATTPPTTETPTPTPTTTSASTPTTIPTQEPGDSSGELNVTYTTVSETSSTYTGKMIVKNPNSSYAWNGTFFAIWNFEFDCSSNITKANTPGGSVIVSKQGDIVTFDLGYQSLFPYGKSVEITIEAEKAGTKLFPQNFRPNYVRGKDIVYPQYQSLPSSWKKGKTDLKASDLIFNEQDYYKQDVGPVTDTFIMYNPPSKTQILIGEPRNVGYPVNLAKETRIRIPNSYVGMGLAFAFEQFKINPNYISALGTKENWTCGLVPADPGYPGVPIELDGKQWNWPIQLEHPDGPFQQESPNFNEAAKFFPDYFPPNPPHGNYVKVSSDMKNLNWISAPISSAISTTVTREVLNAAKDVNYNEFLAKAKDPIAEFTIVTFAYNRGLGSLYERKLFTTNREKAINSTDICTDFNMGGFASHIPTVHAVTKAMNDAVEYRYNPELSWSDMEDFFKSLRKFYANGVPSDAEWNAMIEDVHRAFNVLAAHWGKDTVSYRYDFLTLLRVAKQHLPKPFNPRPTSDQWYYIVKNAAP